MTENSIENEYLKLVINPEAGSWSVVSREFDRTWVRGLSFGVDYRQGNKTNAWRSGEASIAGELKHRPTRNQTSAGGLLLGLDSPDDSFRVDIEFQLVTASRLLRWKLAVTNHSSDELEIDRVWLLRAGRRRRAWWRRLLPGLRGIEPNHPVLFEGAPADVWFMDGWQSWSLAGALTGERIVTGTRLGPATRPMYLNPGAPRSEGRADFQSDLYAIAANRSKAVGLVIGQLAEQRAYGSIEGWQGSLESGFTLSNALEGLRLPPGESWTSDTAALQFLDLERDEPHAEFLEAVGEENQARVEAEAPTGWCSWYYYFDRVAQEDVEQNLKWIEENQARLPMRLIQLDDGYQTDIGDWLTFNSRFQAGHAALVKRVAEAGFTPGLWLAPFIAKPTADIVGKHPDWILRNENGRPVRAGYNWGTFFIALDTTHPGVQDYLAEVIEAAVKDWGYRYLKLDFLYAASLLGRRWDRDKTGAEALRTGLRIIRESAGEDVFLAGCGCPLGPAIGLVDSMRIGPDVAPRWQPAYQGIQTFFRQEPSLPALRNALQNSVTRSALHGRWWQNDPDCLLMRQQDTHLSDHEVQLMASVVAMTGGAIVLSDDMAGLSEERVEWAARLLPPMAGRPIALDQFARLRPQRLMREEAGPVGSWWLLALINWSETDQVIHFDAADIGVSNDTITGIDYWREEPLKLTDGRLAATVPGHGVRLLQLRRQVAEKPQWLGDTLHISGGMVVKSWRVEANVVEADIDLQRLGGGKAWVKLPGELRQASLTGQRVQVERHSDQVYVFSFEGIREGRLQIEWH